LRELSDTVIFFISSNPRAGYAITVWEPDLSQIIDGNTTLSKQPFFRIPRTPGNSETICHPIGNNKAGFSLVKIGYSLFLLYLNKQFI
jgi:hypothetical protein